MATGAAEATARWSARAAFLAFRLCLLLRRQRLGARHLVERACPAARTPREPPADGARERVGDELIEADALAFGEARQFRVQRPWHPQQQAPAVLVDGLGLGNLPSLAQGLADPVGHRLLDPAGGLLGRLRAARAACELLDLSDPGAVFAVAVTDERDVVRQREVALDRAVGLRSPVRPTAPGGRHELAALRAPPLLIPASTLGNFSAYSQDNSSPAPSSARSFSSALRASRETWICEIPSSRPILDCGSSAKKLSWSTRRSRGSSTRNARSSAARSSPSSNPGSSAPGSAAASSCPSAASGSTEGGRTGSAPPSRRGTLIGATRSRRCRWISPAIVGIANAGRSTPRSGSKWSTAFISPIAPTWTRSSSCSPRPA